MNEVETLTDVSIPKCFPFTMKRVNEMTWLTGWGARNSRAFDLSGTTKLSSPQQYYGKYRILDHWSRAHEKYGAALGRAFLAAGEQRIRYTGHTYAT
ncbi:hypothetical protein KM043_017119 [Ampulex compressa]|nr:hypothetical protein KM043_017119 [Ampulex compressa]